MPLLLLPGFFTGAISSSLIPVISKAHANKKYSYIKKKLKQAILFSLLIGLPATIIIFLFPEFFLKNIYGTTLGVNYLRFLSIPFLFYYIELPLSAYLQAVDKSKLVMFDNLIGIIIKSILLYLLSLLHIGIYSFIIASSINIIIVSVSHYLHIRRLS